MSTETPPSPRTEVKRGAQRASYSRADIDAVLDDALLCHVGCVQNGHAIMIPMVFATLGDELLIHGSTGNRVLRAIRDGAEATVSVMLCDGIIVARSAFHHSVNYRSVAVYGKARELAGQEKLDALDAFVDKAVPGRIGDARPANAAELKRTMVLAIPLAEASAKLRSGGPAEEDDDWELPYWAGVIPLEMRRGTPIDCERLAPGISRPKYLSRS
jgi:nitroimidazol reductase NimA-like FMN-containing flavoprotein (pyridoxamine 5'-phosphate oxidase superfamily)